MPHAYLLKAILSACSPWFEDVLMENQHPHPIIIIKDVKYEDIRNIIRLVKAAVATNEHRNEV